MSVSSIAVLGKFQRGDDLSLTERKRFTRIVEIAMTQNTVYSPMNVADDTLVMPVAGLPMAAQIGTPRTRNRRQIQPETTSVWGTDFAIVDMPTTVQLADDIIRAGVPEYIVTANLNYLMLVDRIPRLAEVTRRAAAVIADGHPIVARSRFSGRPLPCRVAGSDLIVELARLSAGQSYKIYFLGGEEGVAEQAANNLHVTISKFENCRYLLSAIPSALGTGNGRDD